MPALDHSAIREKLRAFVQEQFLYMKPDFQLNDDDLLLKKGVVDSMGVMEVLSFLDEEFGVDVPATDLTEANLGSISAIARYIAAAIPK